MTTVQNSTASKAQYFAYPAQTIQAAKYIWDDSSWPVDGMLVAGSTCALSDEEAAK